jgi:hypothetical protein
MATTYDPLSVLVSFQSITFTQLMAGAFLKAKRDEDAWKKKVGATGDVARAKVRNKAGSVVVTLMMTSPTNALLSAVHLLGEVVPPTNLDQGPLMIKDLLGGTLCHAKVAWIKKVSDIEFSDDIVGREWTFDCESLDITVGGGGTSF